MKVVALWRRARVVNSFAADTALTALGNTVIALLGLVTGILSARLLGPRGRGELAAIQNTPNVIATLAMVGMPDALAYFSARESEQASRYLGTASALSLAGSIPFMLVAYFAMPMLLQAQRWTIVTGARWYLLIAPIWAMAGMLPHAVRGTGDFDAWNAMRIMLPICGVWVLACSWISGHATAEFVASGYLVTYAILFAPWFWLIRRRIHGSLLPDFAKIRPMLGYGLPCLGTGLPQLLNLRLDQILMAALLVPRNLGLYVVAVSWSSAALPLLSSVGAAILPSVASAESRTVAIERFSQGVRMAFLLAVLSSTILLIATPFAIVRLFGAEYRPAIPAAQLLLPAAGLLGINFAFQESLRGLGFPYAALQAEFWGLLVTALALVALLPRLGILGAALASLFGYSTVTASLFLSATNIAGISPIRLLVPGSTETKLALRRLGGIVRYLWFQTKFKQVQRVGRHDIKPL
jgi:O-antigen/teichoic acid export membrane protein